MGKPQIAFLGPIASYSHQATLSVFPEAEYELVPVSTIKDLFDIIASGAVARSIIPFENSTNGSVVATLDLFADREGRYAALSICGEIYHDVHHYLLGHAHPRALSPRPSTTLPAPSPRAAPLPDLGKVERIYSHPQAFTQCSAFLDTYLPAAARVDASSTSRAAELVAGDASGASVAIASRAAAGVHGLAVLAAEIEDRRNNCTRFFVVRKGQGADAGGLFAPRKEEGRGRRKTMVRFATGHRPGALAEALDVFRVRALNLTSINQRPSGRGGFEYVFFVEFEGGEGEEEGGRVERALGELEGVVGGCRCLGSWRDELVGRGR